MGRKMFSFLLTSVDGYFAGPDGELDWHVVDPEFDEFAGRPRLRPIPRQEP